MATASTGNQVAPTDNVFANDAPDETYTDAAPNVNMHANAISPSPSGPHDNMSPYLVISCIIAIQGIFPSRN